MSMNDEPRRGLIRTAVDYTIVGDNVDDIANLTIEKYEFKNGHSFPAEERKLVKAKIEDALWQKIEELKKRHLQVLAEMTLEQAVKK